MGPILVWSNNARVWWFWGIWSSTCIVFSVGNVITPNLQTQDTLKGDSVWSNPQVGFELDYSPITRYRLTSKYDLGASECPQNIVCKFEKQEKTTLGFNLLPTWREVRGDSRSRPCSFINRNKTALQNRMDPFDMKGQVVLKTRAIIDASIRFFCQ